jgi:hypothetical protein
VNRTIKIFILIAMVLFGGKVNVLRSCTAFCLNSEARILVGKNLDWPIGDGFIIVNKAGVSKIALINGQATPAKWISKYGSITFNQFGLEFPLGGMNEAGLIVEELSYSASVYPESNTLPAINELQWIQFQLDNYRSVQEVIEKLTDLQISKFLTGLHYFICDSTGMTAVIEFIDGNVLVYTDQDLPFPVLTNNTYANSVKYLKRHKSFGGTLPSGKGPESPERFVRAAEFVRDYNGSSCLYPGEYAFNILDNVSQSDTRWSIVYNPVNLSISFRTDASENLKIVRLKSFNFASTIPLYFSISGTIRSSQDLTDNFVPLNQDQNQALIDIVFDKMVKLNEIDSNSASQLKQKLLDFNHIYSPGH